MNKITTSSAAAQLERMYDDLNNAFFEGELLPDVIITLKCTKGAYGHFTTGQVWRVDESTHKHEINISSATLDRPILQTAATLLHEMVHFYCHINNIRDTSNHGVYQNHQHTAKRCPATLSRRKGMATNQARGRYSELSCLP